MAIIDLALNRGISVPDDLSIIAYDDEVAQLFTPALTAVSPPRAAVGEAAVDLLARGSPTRHAASAGGAEPEPERPGLDGGAAGADGDRPLEYSPWDFWTGGPRRGSTAPAGARPSPLPSDGFGADASSRSSLPSTPNAALGDRSYIAAGAYLTGTVEAGADCSINPYAVVRGGSSWATACAWARTPRSWASTTRWPTRPAGLSAAPE